ncbi:MAG: mRNA-decapping enzyme subunit 2 [Vezdaea aestivalis]|nr:MAG: mRNA-decapping enzyme subunit 2 [Vezdaea aestivalis]
MAEAKMQLEDWLDDLCVRFIINLPKEELESVERICFQVEEAQWFYEDFIRPIDPALPSLSLRSFCLRIFQHCPLLSGFSLYHHAAAFEEFLAYKTRVPVRGAIMLNHTMDQVVLVKGWKKNGNWSFPRGKINKDEKDLDCAIREVYEETGFDIQGAGLVGIEEDVKYLEVTLRDQNVRLYVFRDVPMDTFFEPRTRKEISKIQWHRLSELPAFKKAKHQVEDNQQVLINANRFYMVAPFLVPLKKWIAKQIKMDNARGYQLGHKPRVSSIDDQLTEDEPLTEQDHYVAPHPIIEEQPPPLDTFLSKVAPQVTARNGTDELRRMLSIPISNQAIPSSTNETKGNNLLLLLRHGSSGLPHTPLDQIDSTPAPPRSPKHRYHSHPIGHDYQKPPPNFPIAASHAIQAAQQASNLPPPSKVPEWTSVPGQKAEGQPQSPIMTAAAFKSPLHIDRNPIPRVQPSLNASQQPWNYRPSPGLQNPPTQAPLVPAASDLPAPKLTAQSMALLDVLKSGKVSTPQPQVQPQYQQRPQQLPSLVPSQPSMQTVTSNVSSRAEPKPISHQQSTLLDLFRTASNTGQQQQRSTDQTPKASAQSSVPPHLKHPSPLQSRKSEEEINYPSVSVTVHRHSVTSPKGDKARHRHHSKPSIEGTTEPSSHPTPKVTILPRPSTAKKIPPSTAHHQNPESVSIHQRKSSEPRHRSPRHSEPKKPFHPQILQRPKNLPPSPLATPAKPPSALSQPRFVPQEQSTAVDQKDMLLSLFKKTAAPSASAPTEPAQTSSAAAEANGLVTAPYASVQLPERMRTEALPQITPTPQARATRTDSVLKEASGTASPISPQDRSFLLGYLQDVARGVRR